MEDKLALQSQLRARKMALPPLLLGAGILASALLHTDVWYRLPPWQLYSSAAIVILPGVVVGIVGLLGVLRRLPTWSITWAGAAYLGFTLTAQAVFGELADDGILQLPQTVQIALALVMVAGGAALLFVTASQDWSQAGLFTLAAAATFGLGLLQSLTAAPFNRDDLAALAGPTGLLFSLLLYFYIRGDGIRRLGIIGVAAVINAGIVLVTTRALDSWFVAREAASPLLPLLVLVTGVLVAGPISGLVIQRRLRT